MALGLSIFLEFLLSVIGVGVIFMCGAMVHLWPRRYDGIFEINLSNAEEEFYRLVLETDIEDMAKKHHICLRILKL